MDSPAGPARISFDYESGWLRIQEHLVRMIAPLTREQLRLSSSAGMWSIGTLAAHIVVGRVRWWHLWMQEGGPEMESLLRFDSEERTAAELVAAHRLTSELMSASLARWTDADLDVEVGNPAQSERGVRSRRWIAWHILEHDIFHAGEISQILGMHGLAGFEISDRKAAT